MKPSDWIDSLLDLVYPPVCHFCGDGAGSRSSLCVPCRDSLPTLAEPFCQKCGSGFPGRIDGNFTCSNCSGQDFAFDFARPALPRHAQVMAMLHDLKYGRRIHLAEELGNLAWRAFKDDPRLHTALAERWPLVPVPLHRRRRLWRYFNQADEIARALGRRSGLPIIHALSRRRSTGSQTKLTRHQRLDNLRGAFAVTSAGRLLARERAGGVVLVDDVFTTGATSHECARALRRAGVQKVVVVTVMRG